MKTPNALPSTMITFGEQFGNASMTLKGARQITHINCLTIGETASKQEKKYPYHLIDVWGNDSDGESTILLRSRNLHISRKKLRNLHREITRKVAVFLFENQQTQIL